MTGETLMPPHDYPEDYFAERQLNDQLRSRAFEQERELLLRFTSDLGPTCDIGCSTGEFLQAIKWRGARFGMEVSDYAIKEAQKAGVSFDKNIFTESSYFQLIVFRGTIQHVPNPFEMIEAAWKALKPNGLLAFLMTPDAGSLTYRIFRTLPALDPTRNYWIPSQDELTRVLSNAGFEVFHVEHPYWHSPYSSPLRDLVSLGKNMALRRGPDRAFPGNMMHLFARKVENS